MTRSAPALLLLLTACGKADAREQLVTIDTLPGGIPMVTTAAPIDSGRWSFVHEVDLQPTEGSPGELFDPIDIALADDGTLVVAENPDPVMKVFSPDGRFLRTIGRDGEGPGEFRVGFPAIRGDTLVVQDPQAQRAISFDLRDGSVIAMRSTTCCYWEQIGIDDAGRATAEMSGLLDSVLGPGSRVIRFPIGGTKLDTITIFERPEEDGSPRWTVEGVNGGFSFMRTVPLQPSSEHAAMPDGNFVTGWNGEYALRFTGNGRDTLRIFGRPWSAAHVSDADKQQIVDDLIVQDLSTMTRTDESVLRASYDASLIPDRRPAWYRVWADAAGRVWVRLSEPDTAAVHLDLFDSNGFWLDRVLFPEPQWAQSTFLPMSWKRDRVAVLLEDEEGLPLVRIYRIVRSDS